jgi:hypothetical protein
MPPRQLDGADVLLWAVSSRGVFHTIPHNADHIADSVIAVVGMAICQYSDDERFYLFKCNRDWEVVFDWDAENVVEAQQIASAHVKGERIDWQPFGKQ